MAFVLLIVVFFIDSFCAEVSNKHCYCPFFHLKSLVQLEDVKFMLDNICELCTLASLL